MMQEKQHGRYEVDFDFHEVFFKMISNNNKEINEADLDQSVNVFGLDKEYSKNSEKIIQRTEGFEGS